MNACPALYVRLRHWRATAEYTVSVPFLTMMIAPPGWECQPEEPPGSTVICAMTTSVPDLSGMVPCDTSVPRARGMFVSPDGGVASLGVTVSIVTRPASPTLSVAHRTARFMLAPSDRGVLLQGVPCRVWDPNPAVTASNRVRRAGAPLCLSRERGARTLLDEPSPSPRCGRRTRS